MDLMEYRFLKENLSLFNKSIKRIEDVLEELKYQRDILSSNNAELLKGLSVSEQPIDSDGFHYVKVIDEFRNYVFNIGYSAQMLEGSVRNIDEFIKNLQKGKRPLDKKLIRKNAKINGDFFISQKDIDVLKLKYDK